jgi:phasin family protein
MPMFTNPEQFANATKTLFDLQVQTFNALASKAVQGVEQVVALNMATAKNSMDNALAASRQMSQANDPKTAIDNLQARLQPGVQDAQAYGEQLRQIVADIQNDFQQAVEAKNTLSALIYVHHPWRPEQKT